LVPGLVKLTYINPTGDTGRVGRADSFTSASTLRENTIKTGLPANTKGWANLNQRNQQPEQLGSLILGSIYHYK